MKLIIAIFSLLFVISIGFSQPTTDGFKPGWSIVDMNKFFSSNAIPEVIVFIDDNNGIIGARGGSAKGTIAPYFLRTNDGGLTWDSLWNDKIEIDTVKETGELYTSWMISPIKDMVYTKDGFCIAVASEYPKFDNEGKMLQDANTYLIRSYDHGDSWEKFLIPGDYTKENQWGYTKFFQLMFFRLQINNSGHLYLLGSDLLKSTDHGDTWEEIDIDLPFDRYGNWNLQVFDENTFYLWILSDDSTGPDDYESFICKTADGGKSWNTFKMPENSQFNNWDFINTDIGWYLGNRYYEDNGEIVSRDYIYKTINGGESWFLQLDTSLRKNWRSTMIDIDAIDSQNVATVGALRNIYITRDGGTNWEHQYDHNVDLSYVTNTNSIFYNLDGKIYIGEKSWKRLFTYDPSLVTVIESPQAMNYELTIAYPIPIELGAILNFSSELDLESILISDIRGVVHAEIICDEPINSIDLSQFPLMIGTYFVQVNYKDKFETYKIQIK